MKPTFSLVVGATAGLGRSLSEKLAGEGNNLVLISSDWRDLVASQNDLVLRYQVKVHILAVDLKNLNTHHFTAEVHKLGIFVRQLFLIAGASFEDENIRFPSDKVIEDTFALNSVAPAKILSWALGQARELALKDVWLVSTIAAPVPRGRNMMYAASKRALENLALSYKQLCFELDLPVRVRVLRLGYMDSSFTWGKQLAFTPVAPAKVASYMLSRESNGAFFYFPRFWFLIVSVLTKLPWNLYKRLKF